MNAQSHMDSSLFDNMVYLSSGDHYNHMDYMRIGIFWDEETKHYIIKKHYANIMVN